MLAALARALPVGDYLYEPKWDGLRCIAAVDGDVVSLVSRHGRPLARYFPEVVAAMRALGRRCVVDGELVIVGAGGFDFAALLARLHPAKSRVVTLSQSTPASFIAFDCLALDGDSLLSAPFCERRDRLAALLAASRGPLWLTPATDDADVAHAWLERAGGGGIDGVVAKARTLAYLPNKRAMVKVKRVRTADCVVAGFRLAFNAPVVGSLLLGLWRGDELRHVGVASQFTAAERRRLVEELRGDAVALATHPWARGFNVGPSPMGRLPGAAGRWDPATMTQDWVPIRPTRVVEVAYDHLDGDRFRHPARVVRWRPDRDARSCTFDQLGEDAPTVEATP